MFKNLKEYQKAKDLVLGDFEDWGNRLGKNRFHGGEDPDEADFEVDRFFNHD